MPEISHSQTTVADRLCGGTGIVTEQRALSFAGLLRRLRVEAKLTQEELAAAGVSARSVSNLERGINRTAHKDTVVLLAGGLGLTGPTAELFAAAARGNVPAAQVLAAGDGTGPRPGPVTGSPYRGLSVFDEQDAAFFFGREAATAQVLERMSRHLAGAGLLVVSGVSGAGKSSLLRAGCCRGSARTGWRSRREPRRGPVWYSPRPTRRWTSWRCG
jgi:transcriptional regulator with XRE-family HTH domain